MTRHLIVRGKSKRRLSRLYRPAASNFRSWHKMVRQQICLGRNFSSYIFPVPVFLQRPLEKYSVLNLLRIAEIHKHPDVSALWNLLNANCVWLDALVFLIQWNLHDTSSFEYVLSKVDATDAQTREKIVFSAIKYNNMAVLEKYNPCDTYIRSDPIGRNCVLETLLSRPNFHDIVTSWGVTSITDIASCLLFLLHSPIRAPNFWSWYDKLPQEIQTQCLLNFNNQHRFVQTPYEHKEFVPLYADNPLLARAASFLASQWQTQRGFVCAFSEHVEQFCFQPCLNNSEIIAKLSPNNASVFATVVFPRLPVEQHFLWALKSKDFDLASLLLPFLSDPPKINKFDPLPPQHDHPMLYSSMLSWRLMDICQTSKSPHIHERVRKI